MTSSRRYGGPAGLALCRLVVMLGCVAGLFFMHGLGDHGTTGEMTGESTPVAAMAGMPGMSGMSDHTSEAAVGDDGGTTSGHARDHDGGAGMDMGAMALCVAVLVVSLLLWLGLDLVRDRLGALSAALAVRLRAAGPTGPPRPPDLTALCIQRC